MPIDSYTSGFSYERFMMRFMDTSDRRKPGVDVSYMRNLIDMENGESNVKHLGSKEKQLERVKKYMDKAFIKKLKSIKVESDKKKLEVFHGQVHVAYSSDQLLEIIREAMDITTSSKF